jgi:hypothetical protein
MSIQEIINNIKNKNLINNNYFFGNYGDYLRCGNSYIKLLSEAFPNHSNITTNSIIINYDNDNDNDNNNDNDNDNDNDNEKQKKYKINYIIKSNEIHWIVSSI